MSSELAACAALPRAVFLGAVSVTLAVFSAAAVVSVFSILSASGSIAFKPHPSTSGLWKTGIVKYECRGVTLGSQQIAMTAGVDQLAQLTEIRLSAIQQHPYRRDPCLRY